MVLEAFLHGLGMTRGHRYFDDCLQEARLALLEVAPDATPAYKHQYVKWAVFNFLNKQLAEDTKVFRLPAEFHGETVEEEVIERLSREAEFKESSGALSPMERIVFVLCAASPLSRAQIAHTLGVSERTVRRTLDAARGKLSPVPGVAERTQARKRGRPPKSAGRRRTAGRGMKARGRSAAAEYSEALRVVTGCPRPERPGKKYFDDEPA